MNDLDVLNELLEKHADELSEREVEAFAGMRFCLRTTAASLTQKQSEWLHAVHERIVPQYANLVSRGLVPQGTPSPESRALDEMLAKPKVLKPPPKRRDDE